MWSLLLTGAVLTVAAAAASFGGGTMLGQQEVDGKALYSKLCAACHSESGKGDSPAAAAFDPKPTDFTAAAFKEGRTDEQIAAAITVGKNLMPGFSTQLGAAQIKALVAYVRKLGQPDGS